MPGCYDCSLIPLFIISMSSVIYIPDNSQLFPLFSHYIPIKNNIKTITMELKS